MAEKKKGFNLADALSTVSSLDTGAAGREQIEYINIDRIHQDERNFYELPGIPELAANIEFAGLQQPLRLRPDPERPGHYILVSGHRRHAAMSLLAKEGNQRFWDVACIVEQSSAQSSEVETMLQELRLIFANSDTRKMSSADISKQAERVEMLLYQLKEAGVEFPGKMRDHVAQACKVSAPKLARLKVIREKLIPEYMVSFEKDKLPEQSAYALARLPADFQRRMASVLTALPSGGIAEKVLNKYNEGWRWEPQLTCPDGKACKRGDVFLRRDCEASSWAGFCGGNTCCLECPQAKESYSPCERMCSKARQQRKETSDKKKEEEHKRQQKNGRKFQKETQAYAKRLLRAIDTARVPETSKINWRYYEGTPVSTIRQWAAGEFDDPANWHGARLQPGRCNSDHLAEVSKLLNCSTDFLMGLTEDIRPVAVQTEPEEALALEEIAEQAGSWDDFADALDQFAALEEPARRIRWENRGKTPPEHKPIITFHLTNDGPVYRPAMWDGTRFKDPAGRKELTGLQYTSWLEIPAPGSGESCEVEPPEQAKGQLVICGWMPGGTFPMDGSDVVADFQIDEQTVIREICYFHDGDFCFSSSGAAIDAEVIRWMPLPPVE